MHLKMGNGGIVCFNYENSQKKACKIKISYLKFSEIL